MQGSWSIETKEEVMPKIEVTRNHNLATAALEAKADKLVKKLQEKLSGFSLEYTWRPDKSGIDFKGTNFKGKVDLHPTSIDMLVDLGFILTPFKKTVEEQLNRAIDKLLAS
jgi:putative polyhydroxyalkanoate system protein